MIWLHYDSHGLMICWLVLHDNMVALWFTGSHDSYGLMIRMVFYNHYGESYASHGLMIACNGLMSTCLLRHMLNLKCEFSWVHRSFVVSQLLLVTLICALPCGMRWHQDNQRSRHHHTCCHMMSFGYLIRKVLLEHKLERSCLCWGVILCWIKFHLGVYTYRLYNNGCQLNFPDSPKFES